MANTRAERIDFLTDRLEGLSRRDISHDKLGEEKGFRGAQALKSEFCVHMRRILNVTRSQMYSINEDVFDENMSEFGNAIENVIYESVCIENLISHGVDKDDYQERRRQLIANIRDATTNIKIRLNNL